MHRTYICKEDIVKELNELIGYYSCGVTCSMSESIHGERMFKDFLEFINKLPTIDVEEDND